MLSTRKKITRKMIVCTALVTLVWVSILGAATATSSSSATSPSLNARSEITAADLKDTTKLSAFIDGIMKVHMDNFKIPGAVITIVKDGNLLMAKGYGHSNIEEGTPVDPETSMFRIASTTKLFTWTAVMQLVEQGKIDLDTDINTYLKTVKIPSTYAEPITMRHLMTHTAGFEEGGVGYQITTDPKKLPVSIAETLKKHMLARVNPPGVMMSYSNYGASLAGLIVEEVSGVVYNDFIQKNIFVPLEMKYATVQEPLPSSLEANAVIGYARENGGFVAKPPTYEGGFRPAGSGVVAALDMTKFMIAHLQNGRYGSKQILKPETAQFMHESAFKFNKQLPGMALGFYELNINGQRIIAHGGADTLFNTELYLVPDQQLGIFVSYSGGDGGTAAAGLSKAFFDRYYPVEPDKLLSATPELENDLQKYAGSYQFSRRNHSDIDKFFSFMAQLSVGVTNNRLTIGSGAEQQVYAPRGNDIFQEVGGTSQIGFRTNSSGKVTHMLLDIIPSMPLERTPLFNQTNFWFLLLGISTVLFITVLTGYVYHRREIKIMPKSHKWAVRLSVATAVWAIATLIATFVIVLNMDLLDRLSKITTQLNVYLFMPLILVGLTIVMSITSIVVWKNNYWTLMKRVHYSLVTVSAIVMSLFYYHWNLLGWQFG
ncbi:beta-lactamase family protein [Paenibacillus sp. GSMTC-2017]|uniref:serine hydrolase domain-containing protein n=1 Tax=Paenibacillus sp. GSMTC-2017 TaxID=2794350 RepID=UPI0018DA0EF6|nr:serine hydrolase domain-containing protein [Paenibacillus sp. GSMTC-2017]MBH5317853.1 beta-lactamase family protein [Paenibacillus sp. GSMTC-2017]